MNVEALNSQQPQPGYDRRTVLLIVFSLGFVALAVGAQVAYEHWGEVALATGPIVPLALIWYAVSNLLCANAVYLYCRDHLPIWLLVICWFGLAGGALDHIIETWTWAQGNHQPFAEHWATRVFLGVPMFWFPFVAFGVTSVIGIWGAAYIFFRHQTNVSYRTRVIYLIWAVVMGLWGLVFEPMTLHSTYVWHVGHIFITHLFLSMLPVIIVWSFAPHINVFSLIPDNSSRTPDGAAEA